MQAQRGGCSQDMYIIAALKHSIYSICASCKLCIIWNRLFHNKIDKMYIRPTVILWKNRTNEQKRFWCSVLVLVLLHFYILYGCGPKILKLISVIWRDLNRYCLKKSVSFKRNIFKEKIHFLFELIRFECHTVDQIKDATLVNVIYGPRPLG